MPENQNSLPPEVPTKSDCDDVARRPHKIMEFIGESACKAFADGHGTSLEMLLHEYKNRIVYLDQNNPHDWYQISQLNAAIDHLNSLRKKT